MIATALTTAQQFQQRSNFNTAVRLAGQGFFPGESLSAASSVSNNKQLQGSSFVSNVNSFQSQNAGAFHRNSHFQSKDRLTQDSTSTSFDSNNQNQQNTFSSSAFPGGNRGQFQPTSFVSTSPQVTSEVQFENTVDNQNARDQFQTGSRLDQQNSRNQFQTGSRINPINIQATPSDQLQTSPSQSTVETSFRANTNQQNNQFQQSNINTQSFASNSQSNNNNQFSTGSQQQSSLKSSLNEFSNAANGVFEPLNLPSGASRLLGSISSSFNCVDRPYGYYADQDNNCRVFHVCNPSLFSNGEIHTYQYR